MGFCSARPSADHRPLRPPSPGPSLPDPEDPPDALLPLPSGDSEAPWPVAEGDSELEPFASLTSAPAVSFRVSTSAFASSSASGSTVDPLKKSSSFCFCRVEEVEKFELDAGEGADLIVDANAGFRACRPSAEVDESRDNGGARGGGRGGGRGPGAGGRGGGGRGGGGGGGGGRGRRGGERAGY